MQSIDDSSGIHVLVASDDQRLAARLLPVIRDACYTPHRIAPAFSAAVPALATIAQAAIVDVSSDANVGAFTLLTYLSQSRCLPCLTISAAGRDGQRIAALRAGAQAVMARPVSPPEAATRLGVLLRGSTAGGAGHSAAIVSPELMVDPSNALIVGGGCRATLTPQEVLLLDCLLRRQEHTVGYSEMCHALRLTGDKPGRAALRQAAHRLRRKLAAVSAPLQLVARHGFGYSLRMHIRGAGTPQGG